MSERFVQLFDDHGNELRIETMTAVGKTVKEDGITVWDEMDFTGSISSITTKGMILETPGGEATMQSAVMLHDFRLPFVTGILVRRVSDGAWFRVSGKRMSRAYAINGRAYACVPVERCEPPEQYQSGGVNDEV